MAKLPPNRDGFKAAVLAAYPGKKPGAIPNNAGQLFRFVYEMVVGDLIIYPSKITRQIHIGRINGEYRYSSQPNPNYPHHRSVKWLQSLPRTRFSQGALYEIGSALTFFQIRNFSDEFFSAVNEPHKTSSPVPDDTDTAAVIADDIEEQTEDFILRRLATELKGHPFATFVGHLLEAMGYHTRISPEGPDGGVDIIAHRDELGFEPPLVKVQVKSTEANIGDPIVSALYGQVGHSEFGLLVTLGGFTSQARSFARGKSNLRLLDGPELVALILKHYDKFDSNYKGLVPLKQAYIPQPTADDDSGDG